MNTPALGFDPGRTRNSDDGFSAAELWRLIVDNVGLVILIIVLVTGSATLYAYLATPSFSADALVKVDYPNPNVLGVNSQTQQQMVPSTLPTDAEIQIIQSRTVLLPVIKKYKQDILVTPHQVPFFGRVSSLFATQGDPMPAIFGLKSFAWGGEDVAIDSLQVPGRLQNKELTLRVLPGNAYQLMDHDGNALLHGTVGQVASADGISILVSHLAARPDTEFAVTRFSEYKAVERFLKKLKVQESAKDSGVVQILYENDDPKLAQLITNAIAQTYIAAHIDQHRQEASVTRDFIIGELPRLESELKRAESELSKYRTDASSMTPGTEAASYLQGSLDLEKQIAALKMQRQQVASRFMPSSREVRTIDDQITTLTAQKEAFDKRFSGLPVSERKSADLTRDAKVAEDIYVAMREKASELAVTRAGTIGNVHVIDTAVFPTEPAKPKRLIVIAAGGAAGVVLSVLFVFFRNQLSRNVESPHVVERHLNLPVLGAVMYSNEQARLDRSATPASLLPGKVRGADEPALANGASHDGNGANFLLSDDGPDDMAVETLRAVRASLMIDIERARNNILAVAGATPGTGKTFVASNLAALHAQSGKRVLLIDGDLRRGRMASIFGQSRQSGLAEVLAGQLEADDAIRASDVPGLSIITAGRFPPNPSKLLSTTRLPLLLEYLSPQYDLIIIDTPAVLAVSDANMIASNAGTTVVVVRPSAQSESELEQAIKRLDLTGARISGVIFNAVPKRRSEKRTYAYASAYAPNVTQRDA
ncbi:polysaccharide biosynthesis tyrosine autokinase [Caballeronia telluris]|uniref:Putative tyrosine-protein kinase EpsB n=1 Tax=Caballeronia telluris TaxID=326475 RepID=A0A158GQK8_9BURK|nr:polysaccharide biosynthesis tyrosine autokinase [Caballeronia telluris]SAL34368.1 exopolysaccharide biosynthesis protein [Caballeronia telluris]